MRNDYGKHFTPEGFWKKVTETAQDAGRDVIEAGLTLFYCADDPKTPAWAKGVIGAALGYFIFPLDAIPDFAPFVGYADDVGAIAAAMASLGASITKAHIAKAKQTAREWFGPKPRRRK